MSTHVRKSKSGWEATTECPIPGMPYQYLDIKTYKHQRGGLITVASVSKREGGFKTHMLYEDFHRTLVYIPDNRCTEANVRAQHEAQMGRLAQVMSMVAAHYKRETAEAL